MIAILTSFQFCSKHCLDDPILRLVKLSKCIKVLGSAWQEAPCDVRCAYFFSRETTSKTAGDLQIYFWLRYTTNTRVRLRQNSIDIIIIYIYVSIYIICIYIYIYYICIYIILYMIFTIENWHIPFFWSKKLLSQRGHEWFHHWPPKCEYHLLYTALLL